MKGGKSPKQKGRRRELDVVKLAQKYGHIAGRISRIGEEGDDVMIAMLSGASADEYRYEVKAWTPSKQIYDLVEKSEQGKVILWPAHREPLLIMRLKDFLEGKI